MQVLTFLIVSLPSSFASAVPLLSTSELLKRIADIPHFVYFYEGQKIPDNYWDMNGRYVLWYIISKVFLGHYSNHGSIERYTIFLLFDI